MKLIGLSGAAGSGKDTAAIHLSARHGFVRDAFARPLKEMAKIAFDFSHEQLYGHLKEAEDTRYPFSGTCLSCGRLCIEPHPAEQHIGPWYCSRCDRSYPMFVTPRLAMQMLGTEWGRRLYDNVWIDALLRRIHAVPRHDPKIAITDVRFINEVAALTAEGGRIVRLKRGEVRHNHASEMELATQSDGFFDHVIDNTGSKAELYLALDAMLNQWGWL